MEGGVGPRDGVLRIAATGCAHLMESGNAVADGEAFDAGAENVDCTGYIVASIEFIVSPVSGFPVFGVGAGDCDFDEDLTSLRFRDRRVDNSAFGAFA